MCVHGGYFCFGARAQVGSAACRVELDRRGVSSWAGRRAECSGSSGECNTFMSLCTVRLLPLQMLCTTVLGRSQWHVDCPAEGSLAAATMLAGPYLHILTSFSSEYMPVLQPHHSNCTMSSSEDSDASGSGSECDQPDSADAAFDAFATRIRTHIAYLPLHVRNHLFPPTVAAQQSSSTGSAAPQLSSRCAAAAAAPAADQQVSAAAPFASRDATRPFAGRPERAAAQRANTAINDASASRHGHSSNYPPSSTDQCDAGLKQLYRVEQWEYCLSTNSQLLGAQVQLSDVLPEGQAGLGLFATRDHDEGEVLGYLWGKFVTEDQWEAIVRRHRDNTFEQGQEDYVTPVQRGIHRALSVPPQSNGASLLLASQQCPIAYINQGHDASTNNVEFRFPDEPFENIAPRGSAFRYFSVIVKTCDGRGVRRGEEFTTDYGWSPAYLEHLKMLYSNHLAQLSKARAGHLRGQY